MLARSLFVVAAFESEMRDAREWNNGDRRCTADSSLSAARFRLLPHCSFTTLPSSASGWNRRPSKRAVLALGGSRGLARGVSESVRGERVGLADRSDSCGVRGMRTDLVDRADNGPLLRVAPAAALSSPLAANAGPADASSVSSATSRYAKCRRTEPGLDNPL